MSTTFTRQEWALIHVSLARQARQERERGNREKAEHLDALKAKTEQAEREQNSVLPSQQTGTA